MKTKTTLLFIASFVLIITGGFMQTQNIDGGNFVQGLGSGSLIVTLVTAFAEWRRKKVNADNTSAIAPK